MHPGVSVQGRVENDQQVGGHRVHLEHTRLRRPTPYRYLYLLLLSSRAVDPFRSFFQGYLF